MSTMSKKIISNINFFLFFFTLLFFFGSKSFGKVEKLQIENWIEDIPILTTLIGKKIDVVEFDSSNGKIISIFVDSKGLSKKKIYSFYKKFFKAKNWDNDKDKFVWVLKSKRFKKKTFKIENFEDKIFIIKIITENF